MKMQDKYCTCVGISECRDKYEYEDMRWDKSGDNCGISVGEMQGQVWRQVQGKYCNKCRDKYLDKYGYTCKSDLLFLVLKSVEIYAKMSSMGKGGQIIS